MEMKMRNWITKLVEDLKGLKDEGAMCDYFQRLESRRPPLTGIRAWLRDVWNYWYAIRTIVRYRIGGWLCDRFGHSAAMDVDEFISGERNALGRYVDIDGGGVDWHCPRCGRGGRNWF